MPNCKRHDFESASKKLLPCLIFLTIISPYGLGFKGLAWRLKIRMSKFSMAYGLWIYACSLLIAWGMGLQPRAQTFSFHHCHSMQRSAWLPMVPRARLSDNSSPSSDQTPPMTWSHGHLGWLVPSKVMAVHCKFAVDIDRSPTLISSFKEIATSMYNDEAKSVWPSEQGI